MIMRALNVSSTAIAAVVVGLVVLSTFTPRAALASGVVGTGAPGGCTEGALDTALTGGGSVTFNCGPNPVTITVTSQKSIAGDTAIDGGSLITLSGGGTTSVFAVSAGVTLTVTGLTISDGIGLTSITPAGAIVNTGSLNVTNCTFSGNRGVCPMTDCNATGSPGAILNYGALSVNNSTFSGNSGVGGGAIVNIGTMTLSDSTFSNNSFEPGGAGPAGSIINLRTLNASNCTFAGNGGGDIIDFGPSATATVIGSTFTDNTGGQGFCAYYGCGPFVLENAILAGGCSDPIVDGGHNIDSGTSCGFSGSTGSLSNTDPMLDPTGLANNGGPTQTVALQAGSPAINAGDQTICVAAPVNNLDQRGFVRPGTGATNCSIGAFEFNSPGPPAIPTLSIWGIIGFSSLAFAFVLWAAGRSRRRSPWNADG